MNFSINTQFTNVTETKIIWYVQFYLTPPFYMTTCRYAINLGKSKMQWY